MVHIVAMVHIFQSLKPHVTEVCGVTLTILTPGQKLITRGRSNPLSKITIKGNAFPTFIILF